MFIDRLEGQTRGICAQSVLCAGQVVLRMPHYLAGNGAEEVRKERETRNGVICILLGLKKAEMRRRYPLPLGSRQRQQENGVLNFDSLLALWM